MNNILLIGRSPEWLSDFEKASKLFEEYSVMAIGGNCLYEDYIDFLATYHERDILLYQPKRRLKKLNTDYKVIHHEKRENVDIIIPYKPPSGSSALLGSLASIKLGYDKIVLCGCPLEGKNEKKSSYSIFWKGWKANFEEVKDKVRSMSGWTKELLGEPTGQWISQY